MLERCISRIQNMDPVGTCCRTLEESLFVQAQIADDASSLTLFILDGHLDFLNPPEPEKAAKKIKDFLSDWHSKTFAQKLPVDDEKITVSSVTEAIHYILRLNPHPASEYSWETSTAETALPDIVLTVTKESGILPADDLSHGKIAVPKKDFHFQVKYASGVLPEIRLNQTADYDKQTLEAAKQFINNIQFRQNTIVLQGCAIVKNQLEFFEKGPGNIAPLTRKRIAEFLGIHLSTVSRMTSRKNSKYIQTEFGLFPASYFFSSGVSFVSSEDALKNKSPGSQISAEAIKSKISEIISSQTQNGKKLSDSALTKILNESGIKIARRTVAKYRSQLGVHNSYLR
jgi:RNA polymerase sigma-54 factor